MKLCQLSLLLSATILLLSGCSGNLPTYPVEGQVVFEDGSSPMFGQIEFYNEAAKLNARGKINRDGTFTVGTYKENDGAVEGVHKVVIIQNTGSGLEVQLEVFVKHDHGALVDRAYCDYRTSDLTCTIAPTTNRVKLLVRKSEDD